MHNMQARQLAAAIRLKRAHRDILAKNLEDLDDTLADMETVLRLGLPSLQNDPTVSEEDYRQIVDACNLR